MKKVTIIGNGNMAFAITKGLAKKYNLEVVGRNLEKLKKFKNDLGIDINYYLLDGFDISDKEVIFAVKPNNLDEVSAKLSGKAKVIYSILAGVSIERLREKFNTKVVRVMPNMAASVNRSMTTLTGDIEFRDDALDIFNSIGKTLWLGSEKELDIATALAGSGPAFLALVAEALSDGAVKEGLKRDDAKVLTQGLFEGFSEVLKTTHPALLKDSVMSPGGTTAAGYAALEENKTRDSFIKAIELAYNKAKKIN